MITINGKQVPTGLRELVDPRTSALLIIDMQKGYCDEGGMAHRGGADVSMYRDIIPRIASFSELCRQIGVPVVSIGMDFALGRQSDSPAWIRFHMRVQAYKGLQSGDQGIWNSAATAEDDAFLDALAPHPGELVVRKLRSSAFHGTELDLLLRSNGIRTAIVAGVTTEGCVESTVRDLGFHDYFAVVLEDCVASDQPELHDASMLLMRAYRADVVTSSEVAAVWRRAGQ